MFALFAASQSIRYLAANGPVYPDFFGFWSFARFIRAHPAAQLYDNPALMAFQADIAPGFTGTYPFLYPPPVLLLLWPFGYLPYAVARAVWIALSLASGLFAVGGRGWRRPIAVAMALAPATTVCLFIGQNGLLSAGLLLGGTRLARAHPLMAGLLFGAMVYKPQFAVLIPVAFVAAGLWRAIAATAATAAALVAATIPLFGWAMWPAWLHTLQAVSRLAPDDRAHLDTQMPTVGAAMRMLGGAGGLPMIAQALAAAGAALIVWRCWRRAATPARDASLPVATLLATPYAFGYDLPILAGAALFALADWTIRRGSFAALDLVAVLMALVLPMVFLSSLPIGAPLGVATLALLLWRLVAAEPAGAPAGATLSRGSAHSGS